MFQSYTAFTAKAWTSDSGGQSDLSSILRFVATLADSNHSVLLRALLDREHKLRNAETEALVQPIKLLALPQLSLLPDLSAGPNAYNLAKEKLDWVKEETALKFMEFRDKWRKRLAFIQLQPFLHRNQWFSMGEGGVVLAGKGTRKDSKMLYLQSLHDMASDGERQVSFISGHLFRMQADVAGLWHKESVSDDRSRLLPVLEEALRVGESELCKKVRLSLGDLAVETFVDRVSKWDKRYYRTEEDLFRNIAWPWVHSRYRSGFEGFMETFADLAEAICGDMIKHYEAKWDLFLRGLVPASTLSGEKIDV